MQSHPSIDSAVMSPEFNSQTRLGKSGRWPEWIVLACYCGIVASAITVHEPWADEAQAWQLARSLSLADLFRTFIRYETAPGFWHFFLWILIRLHVSYTGLHWLCGAIAAIGAGLLMFYAPFPRWLRLSLPFTYFLLFQYAVVARNYVLAPPMLFLIAVFWRRKPILVAIMLALLANTSLHLAMISGGLAICFAIDLWRDSDKQTRQQTLLICSLLIAAFYAFAIWTAYPPHDLPLSRPPGAHRAIFEWTLASFCWGIWQPWPLSFLFWITICIVLTARRSLRFLLPLVLLGAFSGAVYANWWHVGLFIPALITILWITWPERDIAAHRKQELIGSAALVVLVCTQILWSGYALWFDRYHAYSPDRATAEFLRPYVDRRTTIVVTHLDDPVNVAFRAVGILPYFDHNILANMPYPFWSWSDNDPTELRYRQSLHEHPEMVVVEVIYNGPVKPIVLDHPKFKQLFDADYEFTHLFCGSIPERLGPVLTNCHAIFEYRGTPSEQTRAHTAEANQ